jgi:hypothetical protein
MAGSSTCACVGSGVQDVILVSEQAALASVAAQPLLPHTASPHGSPGLRLLNLLTVSLPGSAAPARLQAAALHVRLWRLTHTPRARACIDACASSTPQQAGLPRSSSTSPFSGVGNTCMSTPLHNSHHLGSLPPLGRPVSAWRFMPCVWGSPAVLRRRAGPLQHAACCRGGWWWRPS